MPDLIETTSFDDADAAVARIAAIYDQSVTRLHEGFARAASKNCVANDDALIIFDAETYLITDMARCIVDMQSVVA